MQTDVIAQSVISLTYSIIETGCEDQSKRLVNLLPQVIQAVKIASGDMSEDIVDILGVIADFTETHDILRKEGVVQFLGELKSVLMDREADQSLEKADKIIGMLEGRIAKVATVSEPRARKAISSTSVSMENLLGVKANEDRYIRAILLVDNVTSVTLDRPNEVAHVYHNAHDVFELKTRIYRHVQAECDDIQDSICRPRFVVRGEHGAFLDDTEEEASDDFFRAGSDNAVTKGGAGGYGVDSDESADDLAAKRNATQAQAGGWFTWLRW